MAAAVLSLAACVGAPRYSPGIETRTAPRNASGISTQRSGSRIDAAGSGAAVTDPRSLMIDNAMAMLGQPYKWGGATPGGFDCSGLVVYAAAGAGIRLPRTANEQRRLGASVSRSHLEPGDLIFMHLARKELHVGIVLDGARFIHAPSSGGRVRIDSIGAAPYADGFIGARRVITDR